MKNILAFCIAVLSLLAVMIQYDLMIANRATTLFETTIRFFSYFTILTNTIVGLYFSYLTYHSFGVKNVSLNNFGKLTAITVYITVVGLVYQILLRHLWTPTGMQKIVDEVLHTVNPVLVIIYWFISRKINTLQYSQIKFWLIYPLIYLIYVLIRGYFSNFYPYPFLNIKNIGFQNVIINSIGITFLFIVISILFIWIVRKIEKSSK